MSERPELIARIRGGVGAGLGYALDDNPYYRQAEMRRAWLYGLFCAIVSRGRRGVSGLDLFHVKCRAPRGGAAWRADEIEAVEIGRRAGLSSIELGRLLGRSGGAVRIQATRLALTQDAA